MLGFRRYRSLDGFGDREASASRSAFSGGICTHPDPANALYGLPRASFFRPRSLFQPFRVHQGDFVGNPLLAFDGRISV